MLACCIYLLQAPASSFIFLIGVLICAILVCQDDFEHAYVCAAVSVYPYAHCVTHGHFQYLLAAFYLQFVILVIFHISIFYVLFFIMEPAETL